MSNKCTCHEMDLNNRNGWHTTTCPYYSGEPPFLASRAEAELEIGEAQEELAELRKQVHEYAETLHHQHHETDSAGCVRCELLALLKEKP
jgi:hypothetical protein